MDLTPGERAVLGQIRVLYFNDAKREQQVKSLLMLWPPTHYETYEQAFSGLVTKALISPVGAQYFRIDDAGLRAMRIAIPEARPVWQVSDHGTKADPKPVIKARPISKLREALSRLGVLRART